MPEKLARTLVKEELPTLDRPLRFAVTRGARGTVKASSLGELHDLLARPFTDSEIARERSGGRSGERRPKGRHAEARGGAKGGSRGGPRRDGRREDHPAPPRTGKRRRK